MRPKLRVNASFSSIGSPVGELAARNVHVPVLAAEQHRARLAHERAVVASEPRLHGRVPEVGRPVEVHSAVVHGSGSGVPRGGPSIATGVLTIR